MTAQRDPRRSPRRRLAPWLRLLVGVAVLGVLLWRFGSGPFVDAWHRTSWSALLAAAVLTAVSTCACAWRWRLVASRLGVPLGTATATAAYYRSQLLNSTLPGGIAGDADRAVRHGRDAGDLPAGLRAAGWDRVTGQVVQIGLMLLALSLLASPLRRFSSAAALAVAVIAAVGWALHRRGGRAGAGWVGTDVRRLADVGTSTRVVLASLVSSAAHVGVFLVAVAAVGVDASLTVLVPTALLVLVLSAVPLSVAGWGPREGVTAWAFGAAGLAGADGLTVSLVYGVLATVATLPGVVVLATDAVRGRRATARDEADPQSDDRLEEVRRG